MASFHESSGLESLNLNGLRILLVEDSWHLSRALTNLLRDFGAEVSGPVATTVDALRLASEQQPDAALVDFNLRGGEMADDLVERLHEQGIYVVVTTGYEELPRAPRHPFPILHKPIHEAALLGSLRQIIEAKAANTDPQPQRLLIAQPVE